MVGKRVQLDDETWEAIRAVLRDSGDSFQELPMRHSLIC
jgi:hypothetical protein